MLSYVVYVGSRMFSVFCVEVITLKITVLKNITPNSTLSIQTQLLLLGAKEQQVTQHLPLACTPLCI